MCVGLALTGVLQFEPLMLNGGGLKQGVFNRECVGVSSGDNSLVGVRSGLKTFVGVPLPFLLLIVPISPVSLGGGGKDISDNWLPVNSLPVIGGNSLGFGGGGKLSRERFEL